VLWCEQEAPLQKPFDGGAASGGVGLRQRGAFLPSLIGPDQCAALDARVCIGASDQKPRRESAARLFSLIF
jgi:hypothetical protein